MGGPVANCPAGGMHMQTCKHAGMKKTKKAKVKRPKKRRQLYCAQLGLNPGPQNYSAALLPTELCQVLVTLQHLRVYGIVKKKILIVLHQRGEAVRKSGSVKNCGKIAENCDKLRKIAKNCEIAENCEKLRTSISPPPLTRGSICAARAPHATFTASFPGAAWALPPPEVGPTESKPIWR